jgi:hypothetical protein
VQVGPLPASIDTSSNDSRISSSQSDNGRKVSSGSRKPVSNARTISAMYKLSIGDDVLNNSNKNNNISGNSSISNTTNVNSNNNKIVVSQTARAQPAIESEDDCSTSNSTTRAVVVRESKKSMKLNIDMRKKSKLLIQDESGNTSPWKSNSPGSSSKSNSPKDNSNISLDEKIVKLNQAKVIKAYLKYNTPSSPEFNDLMIDTTTNSGSNSNSSSNLHAHLLSKVFPDTLSNAFNNNSKRDNDTKSESPVVNTNSIISNSNSNSNLTRLGRLGLGTVANNSASDLSSLIIDTKKKVVATNTNTTTTANQRPSHIPRIITSTIS